MSVPAFVWWSPVSRRSSSSSSMQCSAWYLCTGWAASVAGFATVEATDAGASWVDAAVWAASSLSLSSALASWAILTNSTSSRSSLVDNLALDPGGVSKGFCSFRPPLTKVLNRLNRLARFFFVSGRADIAVAALALLLVAVRANEPRCGGVCDDSASMAAVVGSSVFTGSSGTLGIAVCLPVSALIRCRPLSFPRDSASEATISSPAVLGVPASGCVPSYPIALTASHGRGPATQLVLVVRRAPW
ncbi:hypothetical protein DL89DRAFT_139823 [Linderina pennispora]|uniref:Uncharacterized protein n=1 Tax=Linderina pennispora TaxID=61395 RepID=A0A1Y1WB46_9FUNG|nr:uncharacterized protein DL89DRAFT_139823 [Linderina pennispora]ORX70757.1 hypothetical protein DL89DRAFT_139823 [Linderina pennispora]